MNLDFKDIRVLVIGDAILDVYNYGSIERMSPEDKSIPVLTSKKREYKLGGALNVANNIHHLGAQVHVLTVCGDDDSADTMKNMVDEIGFSADFVVDSQRPSTCKTRFFSNDGQILRFDDESTLDLEGALETMLIEIFSDLMRNAKYDVVILQDYDKGCLTQNIIRNTIDYCKSEDILCAVDPKHKDFEVYNGASLIKPNHKEVLFAAKQESEKNIPNLVKTLKSKLEIAKWYVTLSSDGIYFSNGEIDFLSPAESIKDIDVCGAGDCVISIIALLESKSYPPQDICTIANRVGALACQLQGTSVVTVDML